MCERDRERESLGRGTPPPPRPGVGLAVSLGVCFCRRRLGSVSFPSFVLFFGCCGVLTESVCCPSRQLSFSPHGSQRRSAPRSRSNKALAWSTSVLLLLLLGTPVCFTNCTVWWVVLCRMLPLRATIAYDPSACCNSLDFTTFSSDVAHRSPKETVVKLPARKLNDPLCNCVVAEANMYSQASHPVFLVISADERCTVAARFFSTSLVHYERWNGESAELFVASESFSAHQLVRYEVDPERWRALVTEAIAAACAYFDSKPKLGFAAVPVAVVYADCESIAAVAAFQKLLPPSRPLLLRHIWFSEVWRTALSSCHGFINVNLPLKSLRTSRCRGSVVCSQVSFYLCEVLPSLWRVYTYESMDGLPTDSLRSFTPIFFTRHGQSEYNLEDRLGGNPDLTASGRTDAADVAEFFRREVVSNPLLFSERTESWDREIGFEVWCSQLRRTRHTAEPIAEVLSSGKVSIFKSLNEIHAGICEDMTNEEVKRLYPDIQKARKSDKVGFRYPNGESYRDLMQRLKPLMLSLYSTRECVLVVAHQAVLRAMLSFFGGPPVEEAVHTPCPQRAIWVCTYNRVGEPRLAQVTLPQRAGSDGSVRPATSWTGW